MNKLLNKLYITLFGKRRIRVKARTRYITHDEDFWLGRQWSVLLPNHPAVIPQWANAEMDGFHNIHKPIKAKT